MTPMGQPFCGRPQMGKARAPDNESLAPCPPLLVQKVSPTRMDVGEAVAARRARRWMALTVVHASVTPPAPGPPHGFQPVTPPGPQPRTPPGAPAASADAASSSRNRSRSPSRSRSRSLPSPGTVEAGRRFWEAKVARLTARLAAEEAMKKKKKKEEEGGG